MISVKKLKEFLEDVPDYIQCYAYEGEVRGVVLYDWLNKKQVGFIEATEGLSKDTDEEPYNGPSRI